MSETMLKISIAESPEEAPNYNEGEYTGMSFDNAVIVKNGTQEGNPTVDLVFTDANGQKYVAMATGNIISSLGNVLREVNPNMS